MKSGQLLALARERDDTPSWQAVRSFYNRRPLGSLVDEFGPALYFSLVDNVLIPLSLPSDDTWVPSGLLPDTDSSDGEEEEVEVVQSGSTGGSGANGDWGVRGMHMSTPSPTPSFTWSQHQVLLASPGAPHAPAGPSSSPSTSSHPGDQQNGGTAVKKDHNGVSDGVLASASSDEGRGGGGGGEVVPPTLSAHPPSDGPAPLPSSSLPTLPIKSALSSLSELKRVVSSLSNDPAPSLPSLVLGEFARPLLDVWSTIQELGEARARSTGEREAAEHGWDLVLSAVRQTRRGQPERDGALSHLAQVYGQEVDVMRRYSDATEEGFNMISSIAAYVDSPSDTSASASFDDAVQAFRRVAEQHAVYAELLEHRVTPAVTEAVEVLNQMNTVREELDTRSQFALATVESSRNDMERKWKSLQGELGDVVRQADHFDHLVSVKETVEEKGMARAVVLARAAVGEAEDSVGALQGQLSVLRRKIRKMANRGEDTTHVETEVNQLEENLEAARQVEYQAETMLEKVASALPPEIQQYFPDLLWHKGEKVEEEKAALPTTPSRTTKDEEGGGDGQCVICFDGARDHVFLPCRHMCSCGDCAPQLSACPICRGAIKEFYRVYMS